MRKGGRTWFKYCFSVGMVIGLAALLVLSGPAFAINSAQVSSPTSFPAASPSPTPGRVPGPVPESLRVERGEPAVLEPGQEAVVTFSLNGEMLAACKGIPGRPVDMMLVFDTSASAGMGPGSNWARTVELTEALADYLARPVYRHSTAAPEASRVGIIGSRTGVLGPEPVLLQPLTDDYGLLRSQIAGVTPGGDTDLTAGIRMAVEELAKVRNDRAQAIVLVLHDNVAVDESLKNAVREVQGRGIPVYVVVNSLNIPPEKQLTRDIAAQLVPIDRIYLDPTPETLYDLWIQATEGDPSLVAKSILVVETFDPALIQVFEVRGPNGRIEAGQVVWDIPNLASDETVELSYRFRLSPAAAGVIVLQAGVFWLDCNGYPQSISLTGQGDIKPATPTPTTAPVVLTPYERPPSTVPLFPSPPEGSGSISVEVRFRFWWLLIPILLLPLIAWIAGRLWISRRPPPRPSQPPPGKRPPVPPPQPSRPPRRLMEGGRPLEQDWATEAVNDRSGHPLKRRFRPPVEEVQTLLQSGHSAELTLRIDEGDREIGSARMLIEAVEEFNPLTGHKERWYRAKVAEIRLGKLHQECGVEGLILEQLEQLALQCGAREIVLSAGSEYVRPLIDAKGYQSRGEGDEIFKPLSDEPR